MPPKIPSNNNKERVFAIQRMQPEISNFIGLISRCKWNSVCLDILLQKQFFACFMNLKNYKLRSEGNAKTCNIPVRKASIAQLLLSLFVKEGLQILLFWNYLVPQNNFYSHLLHMCPGIGIREKVKRSVSTSVRPFLALVSFSHRNTVVMLAVAALVYFSSLKAPAY